MYEFRWHDNTVHGGRVASEARPASAVKGKTPLQPINHVHISPDHGQEVMEIRGIPIMFKHVVAVVRRPISQSNKIRSRSKHSAPFYIFMLFCQGRRKGTFF